MENYQKLESIYSELNRFTNEKAEELIKELKINCSTNKELYSRLDLFDKQIRFTRDSNKFVNASLIAEAKRLLDKEVNDLPIKKLFTKENEKQANFSSETGEKLNEVCPNCWIKHQPYNCGLEKCPGHRLFAIELERSLEKK